MTETAINVTPPPDLTYGYVDGRIILAIGDRSDAGRMPDPIPAEGLTVTFTPANTILKVASPTPATVIKQPIPCSVDANGYLIDEEGARGVWLVTGTYKVTYSHPRAIIPTHDIEVTTGHTEAAPLDLTTAMPPGGPVLAPSEYAELNGRLTILEAGGGGGGSTGVESVSGTVVLDGTGAPVREFWTTGAATIGGVSFSADTAVVFRRTAAGSWGYKVVDGWTAVPIPDTTAPVAGTLASSAITDTGFTLTVSGASDETALHAQPYNFSTDNGTTWTGWQTSSSLAVTGKTASTAYQCRHKVRDAAGNETTGTAITVTTSAAVVTGTLAYVGQQTMTADSNTMTYSSVPIGPEDSARHLVVMLTWWSGGNRTLDLTVDGVAAPAPVHDVGSSTPRGYRLYVIPQPTGTTVTLGTSNANNFQATIAVWTATAQLSLVNGVHLDTTAGSSPVTLTPTSVNDGIVLAGFRSIAGASTPTWTGVTKRWERTAAQPGSGGDGTTSGTTTTVTLDTSPALSAVTRVGATALKWGA